MSIQHERQSASQAIGELYQNSFFIRYWETIGRFLGRGRTVSIWVSAAVVMGANLLVGITVSALLDETQFTSSNAILVNVMWVTYSWLTIPIVIRLHGRMIELLQLRFTKCLQNEQDIHELIFWATQWLGKPIPQLLVSVGFGITVALLAFYAIYPTTKFSFGQTLIYFINFFHSGVAFYGVLSLLAFVLRLRDWNLILYSDDPASSPILRYLAQELRNYIFFIAFAGALLMLLVELVRAFNLTMILAFLAFAWLPILALFILGNQAFSHQITRVKYERLEQLQSKITKLSNVEKMDVDTIMQIKNLTDYHDRINSRRNTLYNSQSFINLIGSLALPTLSAIISTIDVWQKLFGKP